MVRLLMLVVPFALTVFVVCILLIAILIKKQKLLVTSEKKFSCLRFVIHCTLFAVSWILELIVLQYDDSNNVALQVSHIVFSSLLGLYLLIIYCVFSSGARLIWKEAFLRLTYRRYENLFVPGNSFHMSYKPNKPVLELKHLHYGVPGYGKPPQESAVIFSNPNVEDDNCTRNDHSASYNHNTIKRTNSNVSITKV